MFNSENNTDLASDWSRQAAAAAAAGGDPPPVQMCEREAPAAERKSSFSRAGEASRFHLNRRCLLNVPAVGAPAFTFAPGNVDFSPSSPLKPASPGEKKTPSLALDELRASS